MPNIDSGTWDNTGQVGTYGGSDPYGLLGGASSTGLLGMGGSGLTASGVSGAISGIGTAVGDFAAAGAAGQSASEYEAAAQVALSNEQVVKSSLVTQIAQEQRKFELTMGAQRAQLAGAGFMQGDSSGGGSGSGYYLGKASTQQFNVNTSQITSQNYLQQQGYAQQATADENSAAQAQKAAQGDMFGGALSVVSSIAAVAMMA